MPKGKYRKQREARKQELEEAKKVTRALSYFAADGSYGDASGYVVMETTWWADIDWQIIEEASDEDRPMVARLITESYEPDADETTLRRAFQAYGIDLSKYE